MVLQLSSCYPLKPIEVECVQRVGVSDAKWRKWQRTMTTMLLSRNGAIADALMLFRDNVNAVFDGVEECPICYAIVHQTTRQIPKLECRTCHNKFHAPCLYKWFSTSHKNKCPLCQQPFTFKAAPGAARAAAAHQRGGRGRRGEEDDGDF